MTTLNYIYDCIDDVTPARISQYFATATCCDVQRSLSTLRSAVKTSSNDIKRNKCRTLRHATEGARHSRGKIFYAPSALRSQTFM